LTWVNRSRAKAGRAQKRNSRSKPVRAPPIIHTAASREKPPGPKEPTNFQKREALQKSSAQGQYPLAAKEPHAQGAAPNAPRQ
jgi:hypothetical protein